MWINLGRLLMTGTWGFLIFNLIAPFPKPLKYFFDVALIFIVFSHGLQLFFLRVSLTKEGKKISLVQQWRIFFLGSAEFLAWQKKNPPPSV